MKTTRYKGIILLLGILLLASGCQFRPEEEQKMPDTKFRFQVRENGGQKPDQGENNLVDLKIDLLQGEYLNESNEEEDGRPANIIFQLNYKSST